MNVSQALTLDSELIVHARAYQKEVQKYRHLSHWAYQFSSLVSPYRPNCLLLEIGRSIKLFNSLDRLLNVINDALNTFNISNDTGIGKTPKAAYALSFARSEGVLENRLLSNLELANLELAPNTLKQLQGCGFEFVKDLNDIPQAELGQRFGADFLTYLRQLYGTLADPQTGITPPETFYASVDFAEPIHNLLWIQQQLDSLLTQLLEFIRQRQLICHCFSWRFQHESNGAMKTVDIALSANKNSLLTLQELSQLALSNTKLEWAFSSIELSSTELSPIQLFNDDLFNPQTDQEPFKKLVDRLSNRLGHNAIFGIHANPEQLPELANGQHKVQEQTSAPYAEVALGVKSPLRANTTPLKAFDQPLFLRDMPQKLSRQARQPYLDGPLVIIHGPDRISSHWWQKQQSRDYFIARQANGRLLWIFYDRGQKDWFLHGLFS